MGDCKLLEFVQRRWIKHVDCLMDVEYKDRLSSLNLFSVKGRLLRADLIKYFKIFNGVSVISPSDLFLLSPDIRTSKIFKPCVSI